MAEPAAAIVEADGIHYQYGERHALDGLSLTVTTGSVFGLLGPNGSGKSTFITLLAAMERPAQGTLRAFGQPPVPALRGRIGTVFQENTSDPLMTANETLTLAGRVFGMPGRRIRERAPELLRLFGLGERGDEAVSALSGGMRRRLEMARALMHDPELLLLDEPTTGVDPDERRALWSALLASGAGARRTILLATNDLHEADEICDTVAFLQAGRVVAQGAPEALKRGLRREALRVTWPGASAAALAEVESWPGTGAITRDGDLVHITVDDASALVPRIFALAPGAIRAIGIEQSSLEDAYFQHVGKRSSNAEVPTTSGSVEVRT